MYEETRKVEVIMIRPIVKDILFLGEKSEAATKADIAVIDDLIDTLRANLEDCVGMAANMIGVKKRILVFSIGDIIVPMVNPVILKKEKSYDTEESCLSLEGIRPCTRYKEIEVDYLDENFKPRHGKYSGWIAQIIQHELDHVAGIVI